MSKNAFVTGPTSGIGKAFSEILAKEGYSLTLIGRNPEKLEKTKKELEGKYRATSIRVIQADLAIKEELESVCSQLENEEIDVFINNAGFNIAGPFSETDYAVEEQMMLVNVVALTRLAKAVLKRMIKRRSGKILNLASIAGYAPSPLSSVYGATKAYVKSFSEALSEEVKGTGVTVTALCPGATRSNFASTSNLTNSKAFAKHVMSADEVAMIGYKAMVKGKRTQVAGLRNQIMVFFNTIAPKSVILKFAKGLLADN